MQSKGAIKFFAIALAIVCLYQLSFTFVTNHVESKANEYASTKPDSLKEKAEKEYLDSVNHIGAYPLFGFTYEECKDREINLGLDLKGGMNVTMEVSSVDLVKAMSNFSTDPTFNKAIANAQAIKMSSQQDFVTLFGNEFKKLDPNAKLAAIFNTKELTNQITFNSSNDDVLKVIREQSDAAYEISYQIIKSRIDKFGVTQPNVQKLGSGRILVELPGVKEPDRVRKLLQGTAKLEFWETYDNEQIQPTLNKINDFVAKVEKGDTTALSSDTTKNSTDTSHVAANNATDSSKTVSKDTSANLLEKLSGDTNSASSSDSNSTKIEKFIKDNPLLAYLRLSIEQNDKGEQTPGKGSMIGTCPVKDTAKVNRIFQNDKVKAMLPRQFRSYWGVKPVKMDQQGKIMGLNLYAIKTPARDIHAPLEGDAIEDARKQKGQFGDNWEISMEMNKSGAAIWKRLTHDNVGHAIAIVLDDYVYSAPNVIGEIPNGNSQITGNFTIKEAEDLANVLKVGKLPAPAKIVEDIVIGPTLGKEAISNSFISFIIAFIVILLFMAMYYMRAGWIANVALFANIFFIMGVLASLGAVLTLPGIAGIVLTIGLSVDANILIFERVREELRHGKGVRLAVADGFKHAMSSIIDSNVTLLILGIVLYVFGTGPIQGFATTLVIGVLTSLFSAVLLSRLIFDWLLTKNTPISFSNRVTENIYKGVHFNFVKNRKYYYIFSSIVIISGIVAFSMKGLNYGVDFTGGRTYIVQMDKSVTTDDIRLALEKPLDQAPEVKTIGTENRYKITTPYHINDTSSVIESVITEKIYEGLKPFYTSAPDLVTFKSKYVISSQKVGATVADDIKHGAVWAILISCGLMFLYIFIRFRKWQYGLGATVALFHDVLFVLSLFAIFNGVIPISLEIDQHFVAAILTVMGYTMTESVVVFDRIREYLGVHHSGDEKVIINDALNATLSRTINTTLTVFFVLIVIFIFGGVVIRGFIFALLVGRIIGTYSSLCISTPIVIDFAKKEKK